MRKFLVLTFALAMAAIPFAQANADESVNDANGYYDFIPADQLDSSFAVDADSTAAPPPGHGSPGQPGPGHPGGGNNPPLPPLPGPGHPNPGPGHPQPPPEWMCRAKDRGGRTYESKSSDLAIARRDAVRVCEKDSAAGHCRLEGCQRQH